MKKPENFDKWNPAMRGAWQKGYIANKNNQPISECPYKDKRNSSGRLTWSRAFQSAWHDGWNWAEQQR